MLSHGGGVAHQGPYDPHFDRFSSHSVDKQEVDRNYSVHAVQQLLAQYC